MRQLFTFIISGFVSISLLNGQACECTNCPQYMPDFFVGNFDINIQGATNPTLGQNGQGVCGVNVHFDHTAICDITITLTSPSGQTITLVGPIGQFCTNQGNTGTDWNVSFVPCGSGAMPDPGFSDQWDNNQPWGGNNNYSGSYYPFSGCLQNFTGPVNGNWTLTVTDGQANDDGNLYDYEIIFCDPSGINCVSCEADSGALLQGDVTGCQGSSDLALDLPPTYISPAAPPPSGEYSYAYIISGSGGVILDIASSPDLSAYQPGTYNVCGLSYYSDHQNLFPDINGVLTVTQLANQLISNTPPFCGNVSSDCVNVIIHPIPPDEEETAEVCAPNCYEFQGQFFCQTGDFFIDQTDANGCHYNAILHLTVNTPSFHTVNETICAGSCSSNPAFPGACDAGLYQTILLNENGCDSLLNLNLVILEAESVIQPPPMISCGQPSIVVSGQGSTTGAGVSYEWLASNGGVIVGPTNNIDVTVSSAGDYSLVVCRSIGGVSCCDTSITAVSSSSNLPNVPAITGDTIICQGVDQIYSVNPDSLISSFTWTVPVGVDIISGQGDTSIVIQWNTNSGGDICVTANNTCGSSQPTCLSIIPSTVPSLPVITGDSTVCMDSLSIYLVDSISGAIMLDWVITGGSLLNNNGNDTISVVWDSLQSIGTVCVAAQNQCGTGMQNCLMVNIGTVPQAGLINGDSTVCSGDTSSYSIGLLASASGYNWSVPPGASVVSGQDSTILTVVWSSGSGGMLCVSASNDCGAGTESCLNVQVFDQPNAFAGVDTATCGNGLQLTAIPSVLGSSGNWVWLSGPDSISIQNDTVPALQLLVDSLGVYQFQWTETNGICQDADSVQIIFNEEPFETGILETCDGTNQNYTISFTISGGTTPFTVAGGTVTNNTFVSNPIPNGQAYSFTIFDSLNCQSQEITGVFNCNCATDAGSMNAQLLSACLGDSVIAQTAQGANLDSDDIGAFVLHSNPGTLLGTIFDENTSGIFGLQNGMSTGVTYYISYVVGNNMNGLPDLSDPCLSVAAGQPVVFQAIPSPDAGIDVTGCGLSLQLNGTPQTGSVLWSVVGIPPNGMLTITDPQNPGSSIVSNVFGQYTLEYEVTENGCTGYDSVSVEFLAPPNASAPMYTCDGANQNYTVSFDITSGLAPFTVNGVPVSGSTFTSLPIPSGGSYSFVVTDANGCAGPEISDSYSCGCATNAGQVSQNTLILCQSDSAVVQLLGGQNLDSDDVLAYVLHTGSGSVLGTILAQSLNGKFGYWVSLNFDSTYYISAVAGNNLNGFPDLNDPCLSVSVGQPVVFVQNPVPNAGDDFVVCGLTADMPAKANPFAGTWTQISGPATATFSNVTNPKSMITAPVAGVYFFRWTLVNGICTASDDIKVTFLNEPEVLNVTPVCNGTNTGYVLTFVVNNGAGPYTVTGINGSFNGNIFTSVELPNNSNYSFLVKDNFGCQSEISAGNHICNCTTFAGTMDTTPLILCADAMATAIWNSDGVSDADDGISFVLHDSSADSLGTVFATNNQPVFSFGPGLQTGITYYISAIAGNDLAGNIDLGDPCLSISPGTPVQWQALPQSVISGDATICNGSSTVLTINSTGQFPLNLDYNDGSGLPAQLTINDPLPITISVSPTTTSTYSLIGVSESGIPGCSATLNSSVTIVVNQPVNAGMAGLPEELCAGMNESIVLNNLIIGEDAGGTWSESSVIPSGSGAFNPNAGTFITTGQLPGTYTFEYMIEANLPCPDETSTATIHILQTPQADAGLDQLINCHQDSALLGGPGTTAGPGIEYMWEINGQIIDSSIQVYVTESGNYLLNVTNELGCSSQDGVIVTVDTDIPTADLIAVNHVDCFGEEEGSISIESINSNHPPVLFSLNGGSFTGNNRFSNLAAGDYEVVLMDDNGCDWSTGTITITEPPLLSADLGSDIEITFGDSVILQAVTSIPFSELSEINWNPLFDPFNAQTLTQRFLPFASTYVTLTVLDSNGCEATSRVLVKVAKPEQVYIANVIKPGSLDNDRLTIFAGPGVEEIETFQIFDRWGEQVFSVSNFQPNDPSNGWDGSFRGDPVAPAVFVYFARVRYINGQVETIKGDVTVLR
ncbi:MAG: proprotein convertase P-domain-containing protein [Saprospiraceae bacterium]